MRNPTQCIHRPFGRTLTTLALIVACALPAAATSFGVPPSGMLTQVTPDPAIWSPDPGNDVGGEVLVDDVAEIRCAGDLDSKGNQRVAGNVQIRVLRSGATNLIHYYWRITQVNADHTVKLLHVSRFHEPSPGAPPVALDVHYRPDGLGDTDAIPYRADRDDHGHINFLFENVPTSRAGVYAGESSKFVLLKSDNADYHMVARTSSFTNDSGIQADVIIGGGSATTCDVYVAGSPTFAPVYVPGP